MGCCCSNTKKLAEYTIISQLDVPSTIEVLIKRENWPGIIPRMEKAQLKDVGDAGFSVYMSDSQQVIIKNIIKSDHGYTFKCEGPGIFSYDGEFKVEANEDGSGSIVTRYCNNFKQLGLWVVPLKYLVPVAQRKENVVIQKLCKK